MIGFHFSPLIVLCELLATTGVLLYYQEKRTHYFLRLFLFLLFMGGANLFWDFIPARFESFSYAIQFILVVSGICFCYCLKPLSALYWGTAGLTLQHFGYCITSTIGIVIPRFYLSFPLLVSSFLFLLCLEFFFITRKMGRDFELRDNYMVLTIVSLLAIASTIFLNSYRINHNNGREFLIITYLYSIICCILALALQLDLFQESKMEREVSILEQIIANDKQHYDDSLKNMELLNMYCHDLKYFLRRNANEIGSYQQQAEKFLSAFDAEIATCNHALDVILTEKSLYCVNHNISFTCMADGQLLNWLETSDLYALFGNLLSNAIEAVTPIENPDQRLISLTVRRRNQFAHILVENYYQGNLSFSNGLPSSTKEEKHLHGYGLKSIRYIVEKYRGNLTISADAGIFHVNILFPLNS